MEKIYDSGSGETMKNENAIKAMRRKNIVCPKCGAVAWEEYSYIVDGILYMGFCCSATGQKHYWADEDKVKT
jgi:hypothetical protein